jgi:xanthine/CO dehydrogenase XdhC/CoxF family maturation factor
VNDIVTTYRRTRGRCVLATLAWTGGSTYRKRGARALIVGDRAVGMLSGGCVEPDLVARAKTLEQSVVVEYDSRDFPVGCDGSLRVVLETIDRRDRDNPVELLSRHLESGLPGACAHLARGRLWLVGGTFVAQGKISHRAEVERDCLRAVQGHDVDVELLPPSIELTIFGAGPDMPPLARMARTMGWRVRVIDHRKRRRARHVPLDRLAEAARAVSSRAVVIMTHDLRADTEVLRGLAPRDYIGVLGPRARTESMCSRLAIDPCNLHAPAGLDLGGEGAEAVALSIVSEIQAALHGGSAMPLTQKKGRIHDRAA